MNKFTPGVEILNCNLGHVEIKFDKENQSEVKRAKQAVQDMLKNGYILLVEEEDGTISRVKEFDEKHDHYIINLPKGRKGAKPQKQKERKVHWRKARATGIAPVRGG